MVDAKLCPQCEKRPLKKGSSGRYNKTCGDPACVEKARGHAAGTREKRTSYQEPPRPRYQLPYTRPAVCKVQGCDQKQDARYPEDCPLCISHGEIFRMDLALRVDDRPTKVRATCNACGLPMAVWHAYGEPREFRPTECVGCRVDPRAEWSDAAA